MAFGTDPTPDGLANPPIDDLMKHADSKYALAIFAAKRARQINSYFTQLNEGLLQNVGPLVEYQNNEKPLSIAFREIDEGLLEETLGEDDANEGNSTIPTISLDSLDSSSQNDGVRVLSQLILSDTLA